MLAYLVGVILALGPFDHMVVSGLHLLFGIWLGAAVTVGDLGQNFVLAVASTSSTGCC